MRDIEGYFKFQLLYGEERYRRSHWASYTILNYGLQADKALGGDIF